MNAAVIASVSYLSSALAHAREHRWASLGLGVGLLSVAVLLAQSLAVIIGGEPPKGLAYAVYGGLAGFATTTLGASFALSIRKIPQRFEDSLLGLAAGMMLAAAAFSLILPGIEAGVELTGDRFSGAFVVVAGMALGVLLMIGLDAFTPHEHDSTGPCGPAPERCSRMWLFVMAMAIHNLPEGMAVGVAFGQADFSVGIPMATAIALQDIPEGLAVALALRAIGLSPMKAVMVAGASGALEPIGALLGVTLASGMAFAYPLGMGLAAGAMIFVVSHEVIPETHRNGHQTAATLGLMAGFAVMMVLDTALA